jgi:hypothetical protein
MSQLHDKTIPPQLIAGEDYQLMPLDFEVTIVSQLPSTDTLAGSSMQLT